MGDSGYPYGILAEILTSKKVGLSHICLVGELVTAEARLNMWMQTASEGDLSSAEWMDLTERALECEDRCQAFWRMFDTSSIDWVIREGLDELERVLEDSVDLIRGLLVDAVNPR
jgi:hypothetical protein